MMEQLAMFTDGQDLPLFSGTAQRAAVETFQPAPVATQETWATCKVCQDTGRIGRRFCTCEVGRRAWEVGRGDRVVTDASTLSSGTVADLIGDKRYSEIERVQADFVIWCSAHSGEHQTWQEAWSAFQAGRPCNP